MTPVHKAYSPSLPVATQRHYRHPIHALAVIIREEGLRGLARGIDAASIRQLFGSAAQVPSYMWAKNLVVGKGFAAPDSIWTYLACGAFSGVTMVSTLS